ncbi:MAG: hypothetical protein AAF701_04340, partial [Pseudomonadota bacterium]
SGVMGRIIVHIGAPKCGSTYLQRVFLKNQRALRRAGVNYPHCGPGHPGNGAQIDHITGPWLQANMAGFHTLVLSHENLFALPPKGRRLAHLAQKYNLAFHVVAFLRPFAGWLAADYSQTVRQAVAGQGTPPPGFDHFIDLRRAKITPTCFLRDWGGLPGAQLTVAAKADMQTTMIHHVPQLAPMDWTIPRWRANPSLPLDNAKKAARALRAGHRDMAKRLITQRLPDRAGRKTPYNNHIAMAFEAERYAIFKTYGVAL